MKTFIIALLALSTLACPGGDKFCSMCDEDKCVLCLASYLENGKCQQSSILVENCLAYAADKQCSSCYHGFKLQDGKCVEITLKDCLEERDGKCVMCKRNVLVTHNVCGEVKCEKKDCAFCARDQNDNEVCNICDSDKVRDVNGNCVDESENNEHCMDLNQEGKCELCDYNYYYSNGVCAKSDVMKIKMKSDQGFIDKVTDKIKNLFDGELFISLSYVAGLVMLLN